MQFRLDAAQQFDRAGRIGRVRAAGLLDMVAHVLDALLGQRMGTHPGLLPVARQQLVALQDLEELQQAASRLAAAVEKVQRRMVGGGLLRDRELQKRALAYAGGAEHRRAAAPDHRGGGGGGHRDDGLDAGVAQRLLGAQHMSAGDMAALVRDDTDQLVGHLGPQNQAGVDEDRLAAGDERIELIVVDQVNPDIAGIEPGRAPNRARHRPNIVLDLGVAQQPRRPGSHRRQRRAQRGDQRRDQHEAMQRKHARRFCHVSPAIRWRCRDTEAMAPAP